MHMCRVGLYAGVLAIATGATSRAQDVALAWYPLQPGNSWTLQNESFDGDIGHPSFERWTSEETIVSLTPDAELGGMLVTMRTRILSDTMSADFFPANNAARHVLPESHMLIYQNCVHLLDGMDVGSAKIGPGYGHTRATYHDELRRGAVQPDFCFPLTVGMTWGRIPNRGLDPDLIWNVVSVNADPYGPPNETTFRLTTRAGSGTLITRWFTKGIGVVQENGEHHGTYGETRERLLSTTIGGKTQSFNLTPARTVPLSEFDCMRTKWQHFARADGSSFASAEDCTSYALENER